LTPPLILSVVCPMGMLLAVRVPLVLPTCLVLCLGAVRNQHARAGSSTRDTGAVWQPPCPLVLVEPRAQAEHEAHDKNKENHISKENTHGEYD